MLQIGSSVDAGAPMIQVQCQGPPPGHCVVEIITSTGERKDLVERERERGSMLIMSLEERKRIS
jgi:hypothetical protein